MELRIEQESALGLSPRKTGGAWISLEPGEALGMRPTPHGFRVQAGVAWVSWRGEDLFIYPGEEMRFAPGGGAPVVSAARRIRLVITLLE